MHRRSSYPFIITDDVDRNLVNLDTIIVWILRTSVIQSFMDFLRPTPVFESDWDEFYFRWSENSITELGNAA